ncbi:MAG: phosphoenolpyruvate synthase [Anaerolineae bacterium]|nr:phosphoenolpyruvate synthase [Anaerolineae bacterium]
MSLARLARAGLPVPDGFHVTTAAYQQFVATNNLQPRILEALKTVDPAQPATLETASTTIRQLFAQAPMPPDVAGAIAGAYAGLAGQNPTVAVRSSATAEDLPGLSFAGQQETYLNVQGTADVLEAVKRCWASLWTARAIGYRQQHGIDQNAVSLAVVVQRLVPAEAAGVLFTANPVTGRRDQVTISAAWGLGEAVVGGLVTPDTIIVAKATARVLERQTADKQVMTVRVDGGTEERPVPESLRRAPVLSDEQAAELTRLGAQIEELYGMPMDIEWALADGVFSVLQARPITALPEPEAEPPTEWPMPDPDAKYMRGSIIDFMPDPLTPLFESMGLPAITEGMQWMVSEMMGGSLSLLENYLVTINDYAYMNATFQARDLWWILTKMLPAFPRLMKNAARHWKEVAHPRYAEAVAQWADKQAEVMSATELWEGANALTSAMGRYLTTLQVDSLGIAAGTEMLFTRVYEKLIRREGDPPAPTYLLGSDSLPIQAEKALYDLAQWCREHDDLAAYLQRTPTSQLAGRWDRDDVPAGVNGETWRAWQERFRAYLDRYGHSIYDLDFAKPIPAHDPTPLLQTLQVFIREPERNPHHRQQRLLARREEAIQTVRQRVRGLKRKLFEKTLDWAQRFTALREDSIFEIGLAYPVLRKMLLELGRRFAEAGAIAEAEDIFWLKSAEVEQGAAALDRGESLENLAERVERRKMQWRAEKRVTPPPQLPRRERILGLKMDNFMPVSAEEQAETQLKGIGCSPGRVTGLARVLHGPEDFDQMQAGDILVADITTPAWTPLFAIASGIVTNIGGPLSHGSIVAREYGIPAVLGTGVATKRIRSGQIITVDGNAGTVTLEQEA